MLRSLLGDATEELVLKILPVFFYNTSVIFLIKSWQRNKYTGGESGEPKRGKKKERFFTEETTRNQRIMLIYAELLQLAGCL